MAATGKKSKKSKWIRASITDIIAEPTTIPTTNNWADSVDEEVENYGHSSRPRTLVLPSASRAARGGLAVDDESIPRQPPYIAHISNLPYDVDESAIADLFTGLKISNLRLRREGDRLKGYGYIDFEDRESLVSAMNIPDLTISGRRIRIEVSTQDNDRRNARGNRTDRERDYDPERTMGDWRSGPRALPEQQQQQRNRNMEREGGARDQDSSVDSRPGTWRNGDRAPAEPARTPYGGRESFGRDRFGEDRGRERGYGRDGERGGFAPRDRENFGSRDGRSFGGRGFGERDAPAREEAKPRERPKLNLLPRTVPRETELPTKPADGAPIEEKIPEKAAPKPVPAEKVFGGAKPVDTAAKEREIEERLRKQEEEARHAAEEKERWTRRNDHSGERRAGARRDDRGRDMRSYNKDRRDYSKDEKDRDKRAYSKDDKDRRERDRRDHKDEMIKHNKYDHDSDDKTDDDHQDKRVNSAERDETTSKPTEDQGNEDSNELARPSRSRDRHDREEKAMPKLKEQEKPNYVAPNKFSFLQDSDDNASD